MGEYYCPNCNADLDDQFGFDPTKGTWTCTECEQFLMDDDIADGDNFEGVAWFCDNCDALLNRQSGFLMVMVHGPVLNVDTQMVLPKMTYLKMYTHFQIVVRKTTMTTMMRG